MKKISFLVAAVICTLLFASCRKVSGSGPIVTETRDISGFVEIKSEFSGDIFVTQGPTYRVAIESQQNIIDVVETVLSNKTLTLRLKHHTSVRPKERIKVHITVPEIEALVVSGSGNIEMMSHLVSDYLHLKIKGSGSINLNDVRATEVDAEISGSGEINIAGGEIHSEKIDISGSGDVYAENLKASKADIKIAGSGDARVFVTDRLKVRISGSGSVYYKGSPDVDINISGSGSVKRI
jgi:hypothetical protein